ncbi:MAG TPA: N-6 DNA methylase, partial [Caulobacteraceae bacterium]|nr:N-6 DNA methylase [Caulobacteraceae bacterium]
MPLATQRLFEIVAELARRPGHEAVRTHVSVLLTEGLGAELRDIGHEVRIVEARGRIDALLGRTVIEFKSNLPKERRDALEELGRYLPEREAATGERFVGVVTDGADWEAYELRGGAPFLLRAFKADPNQPDRLLVWLDGAVASRAEIPPDALNIIAELGHESIAFLRAKAALREAWAAVADHPTASLQRQLWSQLLTLVHGREIEDDDLWLQHTFLVIVAKSIAARVMEVEADDPQAILSGRAFSDAGILGAVESDFFDWILIAPAGPDLVRRLARHVGRFRLREVRSDVLKILYESLIDRDQRHGLGEYYTPDWLAAKMVAKVVTAPLQQRVLDPACGSGTFLFHAVRRVVVEAVDAGLEPGEHARQATWLVAGTDIHPVAVIIARVTYLLALAPALAEREGLISIPVYLGDAMQLSVQTYMRRQELVITVPAPPGDPGRAVTNGGGATGGGVSNGAAVLVFPEQLAKDGPLFDKLIEDVRLASLAGDGAAQFRRRAVRTIEQHYKRDLIGYEEVALDDLCKTYLTYDELRRAGRNSIWGYVARNLTRPFTFSAGVRWAHVLIGNPPWLAFRHMTDGLQRRFRELAKGERIWVGGKMATQADLCALFTVRAAGLYLQAAGTIAFVLPRAVLRGGQYAPLRTGSYESARIAWDEAWDLDQVEPLFPVPACVLFGRRRAVGKRTPERVTVFAGRLPMRDAPEDMADAKLNRTDGVAPDQATSEVRSVYSNAFFDGATLYPRMFCLVERKTAGRLGASRAAPLVASRRTTQEKRPWKDLPGLEHAVEAEYLRPVYLGESILPFRVWRAFEGVIPAMPDGAMIDAKAASDLGIAGLGAWMRSAERVWDDYKSMPLTLTGQFNFYGKLGAQYPIPELRVVYSKAGTQPAACILRDGAGVIDHMLYWATPDSEDEAYFLTAILNAEEARRRVETLQSRGLFGARDFDKVMFTLPIPRFSAASPLHVALA